MKYIFAYIGSGAGEKSNTYNLTKKILDSVVSKNPYIYTEYEIFTPKNTKISRCMSCNNCFSTCICPLDKSDDMELLKNKMLDADFIIWGSPVYAHQVSGDMKTFIDRLSYWMHLMCLCSKPGMALSTTSSNGHLFVIDYLEKIMNFAGIMVVKKLNASVSFPDELMNTAWLEKSIDECSNLILDYITGVKNVESTNFQELIFQSNKNLIDRNENHKSGEYYYWSKNGYFGCKSFSDLIVLKQNRLLKAIEKMSRNR